MILICVPSFDLLHADFALSLVNLTVHAASQGIKLRILSPRSSIITQAREMGIKELMQDDQYTHILYLDSDMVFPHDTLTRLLDANADVVGATYARRQPSDGSPVTPVPPSFWELKDTDAPVDCIELPTGCLLLRKDVFMRMQAPVFELGWEDNKLVGEDQMLCRKLHDLDYSLWVLPRLSRQLVHLGTVGFQLRTPEVSGE